ncbi:cytochrome P450 [Embleya hyalina]|uniref:cytochrome P450 n=1 Tax=Embleya hyalina TaxID=516124 RepID=UPI001357E457|nr:cytochrome P450 [Embleya hyalina]
MTLPSGDRAWLVTGYREVRALATDSRISADATHPNYPELVHVPEESPPDRRSAAQTRTFVQMDPPEQGAHRSLLVPHFGGRRIAALRPMVTATVDALLDRMLTAGPPVDLVAEFAAPLPARVLTELLGIADADRAFFAERLARGPSGIGALAPYLDRVLRDRADALPDRAGHDPGGRPHPQPHTGPGDEPAENILDTLAAHARTGTLTHRQALATAMMLLVAGHETTENTLAVGTPLLLAHPGRFAALRRDPEAMPAAVEEVLRHVSTADVLSRVATAPVEIAGVRIRAGEGVLLWLAAANRDGAAFPLPDTFDILRAGPRHLAFGHGFHLCLGNTLARLELGVAFAALATRVPTLRPAVPLDRVPAKPAPGLRGITELPVTWDAPTTGAPTAAPAGPQ